MGMIVPATGAAPENATFLAHAFVSIAADGAPWVTGFPGDPLEVERHLWGGRPGIPLPWFIRDGHNNYVAVSSFKRGDDGMFHRRKDNFSQMHLVMVDDVGTKVSFDKLALPPSALVETSPGNYQAWYFLNPPETNRERAEHLIDGMIAAGLTSDASDPGMKGVTRYGRLPVGVNGKAKYVKALGMPFIQRVASWAPHLRYSVDDIAGAYRVDMSMSPRGVPATTRRKRSRGANATGDGYAPQLAAAGLYLEPIRGRPGAHQIVCPWLYEHTDEEPSGTVYFEPSNQNDWRGGFKCHHGHCQGRTVADLSHFLSRLQELNQ